MSEGYVILQEVVEPKKEDGEWVWCKTGVKEYYTSSSARSIDRTDINNAKVFPNKRSLSQGLSWVDSPYKKVYKVSVKVTVLEEIDV